MSLSEIKLNSNKPVFSLTLPSNDKKVSYSPYTNKQKKNLLIVEEDSLNIQTANALIKLVNDCSDYSPETLIDFFFLFIHIKAKSQGEDTSFEVKKCFECDKEINKTIDIENILEHLKIKNKETKNKLLEVNSDLSIKVKPTSINIIQDESFFVDGKDTKKTLEFIEKLIAHSIDKIIFKNKIYDKFTPQEFIDFIYNELTDSQIEKINSGINDLVSVGIEISYDCPECNKKVTNVINNLFSLGE